jgi:hypothetical protein
MAIAGRSVQRSPVAGDRRRDIWGGPEAGPFQCGESICDRWVLRVTRSFLHDDRERSDTGFERSSSSPGARLADFPGPCHI